VRVYTEKELRILAIVVKVLLCILGAMLLLAALAIPLLSLPALGAFYFAYKYKAKNKPQLTNIEEETPKEIPEPQPGTTVPATEKSNQKHFFFNVVGISKTNDEGKDIQKLIRRHVKDELEYTDYAYEGMTNKEILEYGEDVYEADISGDYEVTFEPEPDNPYDPKAIKVKHEDIGHIGYVPRDYTSRVFKALSQDYKVEWKLVGGKYKYVDWEEDKVRTKTLNYGVVVDVTYKEASAL